MKPEIRELMFSKRVQGIEIAKRSGVSGACVSLIINRKRAANEKVITAVAQALGLPKSYVYLPTITPRSEE